MNAERDQDRLLERALTQELRGDDRARTTDACLDAETLAAWMDGGLDRDALASAERHAAACPRCRALVATFAQTASVEPSAHQSGFRLWRWWLAPLAAATAATVLWMVVPAERPSITPASPPAQVSSPPPVRPDDNVQERPPVAQSAPASAPSPEPLRKQEAERPGADAATEESQNARARSPGQPREQRADTSAQDGLARSEPPAAEPVPAPAAIASFRSAEAMVDVRSPDPAIRWRLVGGRIERSTDSGRSWARVGDTGGAILTAGASPSPDVSWWVGRGGAVLLTVDARGVTRLPFPEPVDSDRGTSGRCADRHRDRD